MRTHAAVLSALILLPGCASTPPDRAEPVSPAVFARLQSDGEVRVVIALTPPEGFHDPDADPVRLRAEIARLQSEVLAELDPEEFQVGHRYQAIPALTGTILSERALRTLAAHPSVLAVDLDPGGTGGRPDGGRGPDPGRSADPGRSPEEGFP